MTIRMPKVEAALAWAAQQTYSFAEDAAAEYGKAAGREMYLDQPYYNSFGWRDVAKDTTRHSKIGPPMRVNCYEVDNDGTETLTAKNVFLVECLGDDSDEEVDDARRELMKSGRYWGGGGAAARFLLILVR